MPSPYDQIIDDLAKNDPEFLKLSPDQQDSLVENLAQERAGKIPSSNAVLDRAAKDITPFWSNSDIPKVAFQTGQGLLQNAPQNIVENPMTTAMSGLPGVQAKSGMQAVGGIASLFGKDLGPSYKPETTSLSDKYLNPKSLAGQGLGFVGNLATNMVNPMIGIAPTAGKVIESVNPISTMIRQAELPAESARAMQTLKGLQAEEISPLGEKISRTEGIRDLIKGQQVSRPRPTSPKVNKASMDEIIFSGKEEIGQKSLAKAKEYTDKFGEGFSKLDSTMTKGNFAEIGERTIDALGAETQMIPGTPANKIKTFLDKLLPLDKDGMTRLDPDEILSPEAVQAASKALKNALSTDLNAQIKFSQNLMESLPETVKGLKELKADYAPKFATMLGAKKYLTGTGLSKIASGSAGPSRIAKMEKFAGEIGSESVGKAKSFAEGSRKEAESAQKVAKEFDLNEAEIKEVGEKFLSYIGKKLDAYGEERANFIAQHKAEAEDLMNMFRDARETLGKEKITKYKRLATLTAIASALGFSKVRQFFKEKF